VFLAQEQVQIGIVPRTPVVPPALPVGTPEVAHAFTEHFDRSRFLVSRSAVEDEIRTAMQVYCGGRFRDLIHSVTPRPEFQLKRCFTLEKTDAAKFYSESRSLVHPPWMPLGFPPNFLDGVHYARWESVAHTIFASCFRSSSAVQYCF
jgi:hypothetical protein